MTPQFTNQRIPQGGQPLFCTSCDEANDNWLVGPQPSSGMADYRCPEPGCTGTFTAGLRVFAKRSDATDRPEFRQ